MKKTLHIYGILFLSILLLSQAQNVTGQAILYENFDYTVPGYIGGNGNAGSTSNNWTTHSVTTGQTTTIDLYTGSLSYLGLMGSSGNKILMPGANSTVSRDVNAAITTTVTTIYFSALVNVVDNTQLSLTTVDYFMCIGAT